MRAELVDTGVPLRGNPPGRWSGKNPTFAAERECRDPACATKLSVYNADEWCWLHAPMRPYVMRTGRRSRGEAAP